MSDVNKMLDLMLKAVNELSAQEVHNKFAELSKSDKLGIIILAVNLCINRPDLVDEVLRLRAEANIPDC